MDLPQAPQDTELRNIIDKLAQFVARNGPEFEQMTKTKQKGNAKFQFLYGGEYYAYYQYKVQSEQAIVKQQQLQGNILTDTNWNTPPPTMQQPPPQQNTEIDHISQQQDVLREQIKQSEQNLSAQHTVLMQQQQAQVEATVKNCENDDLQNEADNCGVSLQEIHNILQPIIDSCTKDSISNGKQWFLLNASNRQKAFCIVKSLLYKVLQAGTFSQKLHVIYLVNDLLHHSARKNANDLKEALESVVVPMFCNASIAATDEQRLKLDKLLKLWESKSNYLANITLDKMHQPLASYQQYQSDQMAKYATQVTALTQQTKATFDSYQQQHQAFVCHAMQQIMDLQQQKQNLETNNSAQVVQPPPTNANIIPLETIQANLQQTIQNLSQNNNSQPFSQLPPPSGENFIPIDPSVPPPNLNAPPHSIIHTQPPADVVLNITPPSQQSNGIENPFSQPPPGFFPPPGVFPDFSKPPPGFLSKPEPVLEELMPTAPYYDLPAGLIVPLIKLEDTKYKPLDPKDIRLPPPAPPSDRLLAAVDAFYSLPSHERPRDSEGWEKLGLYEYYKAKNNAKKEKEELLAAGLKERSRSPSPIILPVEKEPSPPRRRYRSKSPTPPPSSSSSSSYLHRNSRRSRSRTRSRSRSRSRSPRRRSYRSGRERRRRSRSHSRSRSPPPLRHSPSPPPASFSSSNFLRGDMHELDSSNKGHQMLRKMGWAGAGGLGANEQGIDQPISGGDIRDKQDQFKGVGCNLNDPYENFRKNKGAAFITRMKARAEERANERKIYD